MGMMVSISRVEEANSLAAGSSATIFFIIAIVGVGDWLLLAIGRI
uniref:Putative isoprenylcysteine alpha-carbonyl methylesterase ICMEL1 isoform X1 n=1 Tax=Rhizophora mucronata TaxID=61149 RepID=A0A2P2QQE5_RHIMU